MNLSTMFRVQWVRVTLFGAFIVLAALGTHAQTPTWASLQRSISSGTGSISGGRRMVVGADGSQYITGGFIGNLTLGLMTLTASNSRHVFLAKYSAAGAILWSKVLDGRLDSYLAVDAAGNVYMTGFFAPAVTFGAVTLTTTSSYDSYLVKYNAQGVQQWVLQGNGIGVSTTGIAIDAGGNVVIVGDSENTVSFGGAPLISGGITHNIFYYKFSPTGVILQAKRVTNGSDILVNGMALDGAGNVFIAADFSSTATFGTTALVSNGNADILLCKLDAAGNFLWARHDGGTDYNSAASVAVDANGNPLVVGYYNSTSTSAQAYVALYTTQGTQIWSRQVASVGVGYTNANSVTYDGRGGFLVTGTMQNSAVFGTTPLTAVGTQLFVARYDGQGNTVWADRAVGTSSTTDSSAGNNVVVDANGNGFIVGNVGGNVVFGALPTTAAPSASSTDILIAKLVPGGVLAAIHSAPPALALACYPNPASSFANLLLSAGGGHLVFVDIVGRVVREQELPTMAGEYATSLAGLAPGLYQLCVTLANGQIARTQLAIY
ncbi:MAG: hypothetical protein M3Y54_00170 [Bacteroidota bacterium]|nr:hypothetical protein [Bacteroidota bacterium]